MGAFEDIEGRKRPRTGLEMQVFLQPLDGSEVRARCHNASMNGVFVSSPVAWEIGTRLKLHMLLTCGAEKANIAAEGRVVRLEPVKQDQSQEGTGIGIAFTALDANSSTHLYRLLQHQETDG